MNFKAVIFDLDGTLLDSLEDLANTLNSVLDSNRLPMHETEAFRYLVGHGMGELVRKAVPQGKRHDRELLKKLEKEMLEHYALTWNNSTEPYPGIPELLDWLNSTPIKKGVLSNKSDKFTKLCVETLLSPWHFDLVTGHHPGINHKPDPQGAFMMAEKMHVDPTEVLFVGDSGVDMQTATAAGMYPLGVLWGFRTKEELLASGAKSLVEKPQEIIDLLSKSTQ